jgi:hypothetical protein
MIALIVIACIVLYLVAAFATGGWIYYSQTVYPERWRGPYGGYMAKDDRDICVALGAAFWPIAWTICIPGSAAMRFADWIAARGVERRKIADAEREAVEREMRELER